MINFSLLNAHVITQNSKQDKHLKYEMSWTILTIYFGQFSNSFLSTNWTSRPIIDVRVPSFSPKP